MKKFVVAFVLALVFASVAYAAEEAATPATPAAAESVVSKATTGKKYVCLMDGFESDKPGKCEKCGMELVETDVPAATEAAAPAAPAAS